ncbi:MAG: TetR/AcrR family transcriptional regulator [Desulfobacter sp.]|nr:MAG: TetR/AcrR family transcriptional regulator [Desulfobacter sp.]
MGDKREDRKKRNQARNRQEVLWATVNLFFEKGYKGVTVPEIARAVEFGVGTLYRLFPGGKEEIYHAMQTIVVQAFEEKVDFFTAQAGDEVEIIRQYIRSAAAVYDAYPKQMAMYLRDTAGVGLDLGYGLPESLASRYRACGKHVEKAIRTGEQKGRFNAFPKGAPMMCLRSIINGFFMNNQDNEPQMTMEKRVELIETFFFNGLLIE